MDAHGPAKTSLHWPPARARTSYVFRCRSSRATKRVGAPWDQGGTTRRNASYGMESQRRPHGCTVPSTGRVVFSLVNGGVASRDHHPPLPVHLTSHREWGDLQATSGAAPTGNGQRSSMVMPRTHPQVEAEHPLLRFRSRSRRRILMVSPRFSPSFDAYSTAAVRSA